MSSRDRLPELAALAPLYESWRAAEAHLRATDPARLLAIKQRLVRRMIVEIGLLESLYELDRATTEKFVTHGFSVEQVTPQSSNKPTDWLVTMLRHQEATFAPMLDAPPRALTKDDIRRFHAVAMQNQENATTTDTNGVSRSVPLVKGQFKALPNHLKMPDGLHQFCPVEQVEPELDALLARSAQYVKDEPTLAAAYMHYHLYHTHPFQMGNGRIVRAATAQMLLREGLLPIVIEREERAAYKAGMAPSDSLAPLAGVFARSVRATINDALEQAKESRKAS